MRPSYAMWFSGLRSDEFSNACSVTLMLICNAQKGKVKMEKEERSKQ